MSLSQERPLGSSTPNLAPVEVQDIDKAATESPAWMALKRLLALNHEKNAILYNSRRFHNHIPHALCSSILLGGQEDDLQRVYDSESEPLVPWEESPAAITTQNWRSHLGHRDYERAFVEYFHSRLEIADGDWRGLVADTLLSVEKPVINSIIGDVGHPLIHLAYAFEMGSSTIATEALGLATTCYNKTLANLTESIPLLPLDETSNSTTSPFEILDRIRKDVHIDTLFSRPGTDNFDRLLQTQAPYILKHVMLWKIDNPVYALGQAQEVAASMLMSTGPKDKNDKESKYDFFILHLLTTSHALRVILPELPENYWKPLIQQWWLVAIAIYIAQLRPEFTPERVQRYELNGRDWSWAAMHATKGDYSTDAHYIKGIRAFKEMAAVWGDPDQHLLQSGVKFAEEFSGWGGFD